RRRRGADLPRLHPAGASHRHAAHDRREGEGREDPRGAGRRSAVRSGEGPQGSPQALAARDRELLRLVQDPRGRTGRGEARWLARCAQRLGAHREEPGLGSSQGQGAMKRDYRKWRSPALGRDMEMLVFGDRGTPVLVYPTSMGRFYQWEDFGMIAHMSARIDEGWLQLWCVDSVDSESFYAKTRPWQERAARHLAYERYILDEVVPAIRAENEVDYLISIGASFGALHALTLA